MARQPKVEVALLADAGAMVRGFRQASGAADDFDGSTARVSKAVGIMDKAILGAAAAIGGGLVLALKNGFTGLKENEQASAQTAAAIKSTGGAANVTTGQIEKLADGIEKKSGMDAHAIQSGQNLLLTFTKIKNEAGDGNDIFDQTTKVMADMATAMGTDPKSAAMQLGKALNDPVKGVSALGRAGVQFTKEQKEQIKTLVESGDTMGAQKMILKELETQFGG
jgi:phage-related minor tail protein